MDRPYHRPLLLLYVCEHGACLDWCTDVCECVCVCACSRLRRHYSCRHQGEDYGNPGYVQVSVMSHTHTHTQTHTHSHLQAFLLTDAHNTGPGTSRLACVVNVCPPQPLPLPLSHLPSLTLFDCSGVTLVGYVTSSITSIMGIRNAVSTKAAVKKQSVQDVLKNRQVRVYTHTHTHRYARTHTHTNTSWCFTPCSVSILMRPIKRNTHTHTTHQTYICVWCVCVYVCVCVCVCVYRFPQVWPDVYVHSSTMSQPSSSVWTKRSCYRCVCVCVCNCVCVCV